MSETDWQHRLDDMFPDGCIVTQIKDIPERVEDSTSVPTPKLRVVDGNNGETPTVTFNVFGFEKDVTFTVAKLEEFSPGTWLATQSQGPNFLLSDNMGPELRSELQKARKEWYGDESEGTSEPAEEES